MIIFSCVAKVVMARPQYLSILDLISLEKIMNAIGWIFVFITLCMILKK